MVSLHLVVPHAVTERTFYNILNASADASKKIADEETRQLLLFNDDDYEQGRAEDNRPDPAGYPGGDDR